MKKLLLLLSIIVAIWAIDLPEGFIQIDQKNIPPTEQIDSSYVRYINSIRIDVDPLDSSSIGIYCLYDSLGYHYHDSLVLIIEKDSAGSRYYADTLFMNLQGWSH